MTNNPNELTIENSVLVLIDHQPAVAINVRSIDLGLVVNNVAALSRVAKAFGVPTVLTTVGAQGSVLVDPLTAQWAQYWASAERARVSNIESQRGATTSALVFDWIMAQVKAGVVSLPDVLSTPVLAGSR